MIDRFAATQPVQDGDSSVVRALLTQSETLTMVDGVLYRDALPSLARQLVVPVVLRPQFLAEAHAGQTSGHFGSDRTLARLRQVAFWPGMSVDVSVFVNVVQCASVAKIRLQKPHSALCVWVPRLRSSPWISWDPYLSLLVVINIS